MTKMDEREFAQQLDTYIDRATGLDPSRKAPEASIVDALHASAARVQPAPDFVEGLSVRLRQHQPLQRHGLPRRAALSRVAWAGAAIALVTLLALALPALVGERGLVPLPRLVHAAGSGQSGLLAGADLRLAVDLPKGPARVPVYDATNVPLPATADEAVAWAEEFGLDDPRAYRDPREPQAIFVLGSNGQRLTFRTFGPQGSIHYGDEREAAVEGPVLGFEEAADLAVAFLRAHGLLPDAYQVREPEGVTASPQSRLRFVEVVPALDGRPLVGTSTGATVTINPAGQVSYAAFTPLTFDRSDSYPIRPAEEAYEELAGGRLGGGFFRLDLRDQAPSGAGVRTYRPEPPAYAPGDGLTVTGWVQVLVAEDGSDLLARLDMPDGTEYELEGPRIAGLDGVGFEYVKVQGTVVAGLGPGRWQVEVSDWDVVPHYSPWCSSGTLAREEGAAWLVAAGGQRYRLAQAPDELTGGEGIQVCAHEKPADGEMVEWWMISSPSLSEQEGVMSSGSVSVVVDAEELEWPEIESPFEMGQSVEISGTVNAVIYVNGSERQVVANLDVADAGPERLSYPLSGPPDVLEALAQLAYLHVQVRGHIVHSGQGGTPGGQAIEVASYEKVWPGERVQGFLGYLGIETLEGLNVTVFTDEETGQRYVLASTLEHGGTGIVPHDIVAGGRRVYVGGVVEPGKSHAGLPVLRLIRLTQDSRTDAAGRADEIPLDVPQVIDQSLGPGGAGGSLQGAFVVDRAELAYYYEPPVSRRAVGPDGVEPTPEPVEHILQPVWVFYGHSADGRESFAAYVQAVAEEYIQDGAAPAVDGSPSAPLPPAVPVPMPVP